MKKAFYTIAVSLFSISFSISQNLAVLKDINPSGDAAPGNFVMFNNKVIFSANGANGYELWITDGTTSGTQELKDINTNGDAYPANFTVFGNKLLFSATDSNNDTELWITDGTSAGTTLLKNINASASSFPSNLIVFNNKVFFTADDGTNGKEIWTSDGTSAGTGLFTDLNPGNTGSFANSFTIVDNKLYFAAMDASNHFDLYVTDGTSAGTQVITTPNAPNGSNPYNLTGLGNKLIFNASDDTNGDELFVYDGATISILNDILTGTGSSNTIQLGIYNSELYFSATDGTSYNIYKTDGTAAGTEKLSNHSGLSSPISQVFFDNNYLHYVHADANNIKKLNRLNLTTITDVSYYNNTSAFFSPAGFKKINNTIYFVSNDSLYSTLLYKINDVSSFDFEAVMPNDSIQYSFTNTLNLFLLNGKIFASGNFDNDYGHEIYIIDNIGVINTLNIEEKNFNVYPNPVINELTISGDTEFKFTVLSGDGRQVITSDNSSLQHTVNVNNLQSGVYFINIENSSKTIKFIKL